jgi:hypothetical protein
MTLSKYETEDMTLIADGAEALSEWENTSAFNDVRSRLNSQHFISHRRCQEEPTW